MALRVDLAILAGREYVMVWLSASNCASTPPELQHGGIGVIVHWN